MTVVINILTNELPNEIWTAIFCLLTTVYNSIEFATHRRSVHAKINLISLVPNYYGSSEICRYSKYSVFNNKKITQQASNRRWDVGLDCMMCPTETYPRSGPGLSCQSRWAWASWWTWNETARSANANRRRRWKKNLSVGGNSKLQTVLPFLFCY